MYRRKGEKIMKRRYERPSAYIEEFTPNEYVAACGDSGTVYMFRCDAGGGYSGTVWLETNGEPGLQKIIQRLYNIRIFFQFIYNLVKRFIFMDFFHD